MMKKALIAGVAGQDGYYLTRFLAGKGYSVYGADRDTSCIAPDQKLALSGVAEINFFNSGLLVEYIKKVMPDEIYYLAAHHFSSQGDENRSGRMSPFLILNLITPNEVLEFIQSAHPECRFFYAASAHVFGKPEVSPQTENTPHNPDTPYAISKSAAVLSCRYYRAKHKIFAVSGILYNHESPRRPADFITTQIARVAAKAARGEKTPLLVRNLNAVVDWGAAEDYVQAMWHTLQQPLADEFIIATGITRTVMDFAREAFRVVDLKPEQYVLPQTPAAVQEKYMPYVGDCSKIRETCGWQPVKTFSDLVREMVEEQISLSGRN